MIFLTDSCGALVNSYGYNACSKAPTSNETINQPYRYASYW